MVKHRKRWKSHLQEKCHNEIFPVLRPSLFSMIPTFEENLYSDMEIFDWKLGVP